ncbi:virion structural protein [Ochrobactrum phage POI1126]|uniref:Uncharacterized protein n=4 Tax=root TaxID=1 RepID=A0A240F4T0_9CAUD|nr:hypothetical protein [Brucella intermedia]YP_010665168.1 virion structural protein [Ochrobactrum phage POI1126]APU92955.1 hypothetical protein POI1126_27 [Ochrobactrum phage POI1126]EEQ92754.1 Conserved hypothetical protein [Brucella intermedia LMG 3301]SUA82071.1 Uncharacterised protein [Brucella intermedia]
MSFGAGLAGFVDGLEAGMRMRDRWDERKEKQAYKAKQDQLNADTKKAFADAQAAGAVEGSDFQSFWLNYQLPKQQALLMEKGDYAGAKALGDWGRSDDALKGGKLFSSALVKAQSGDYEGAFQDVYAGSQLQGYISSDVKFAGAEPIQYKGKTVGYRVKANGPDGKAITRDYRLEDIPAAIAQIGNPLEAYKSQTEARAAEAKRKSELENYEDKKKIDQKYSGASSPEKQSERYQKAAEQRAKSDLNWDTYSDDEKDKLIRKDLSAADSFGAEKAGQSNKPADKAPELPKKIIVDTESGNTVDLTSKEQPKAAGLGDAPVPAQKSRQPEPIPSNGQLPTPEIGLGSPQAGARSTTIGYAKEALARGGDPARVKQQLMNAGVPQDEWPEELSGAGNGVVGLGR